MKFRDVRVSFNFEVEQFHDTRTGRTIDLSVKKKKGIEVVTIKLS